MQTNYAQHMPKALPGMMTTATRNIVGSTVAEEDIPCGALVMASGVDALGHIKVKLHTGTNSVYGVAIRSVHAATDEAGNLTYKKGHAVNVMTMGECWVRDSSKTAFGTAVKTGVTSLGEFETAGDVAITKCKIAL